MVACWLPHQALLPDATGERLLRLACQHGSDTLVFDMTLYMQPHEPQQQQQQQQQQQDGDDNYDNGLADARAYLALLRRVANSLPAPSGPRSQAVASTLGQAVTLAASDAQPAYRVPARQSGRARKRPARFSPV
jgi:hypothetical protein